MKVRIINEGPEPYVALVSRGPEILAEIAVGQATDQYTWKDGFPLVVSEK